MEKITINNYVTYYRECSEEDVKLLHLGDEYKLEKMIGNQYCVECDDMKTQLILNIYNQYYEILEIKKGKYVDNPLVGAVQVLIRSGIVSNVISPSKYELPLNVFIQNLKIYLSVWEKRSECKIDEIINYIKAAFKRHEYVEADNYSFKYVFNDGIVTVYGKMIPIMMVRDFLYEFI